jgi:hypothetical protein
VAAENPRVGGSIPPLATTKIKLLAKSDTDVKVSNIYWTDLVASASLLESESTDRNRPQPATYGAKVARTERTFGDAAAQAFVHKKIGLG